VLKIVRPGCRVVLLEPREKRVAFLRHVIRQTGLKDIEVAAARIEEGRARSRSIRSSPAAPSPTWQPS
jgi:16S rRNA G527 N7-methylase RsmG